MSSTASSLWSAASSTASEIYTSVQSGQFMKTFEMGEEEDEASTGASKDDPSMGNKKHEPEQANEVFDEESWMKEQLEAARYVFRISLEVLERTLLVATPMPLPRPSLIPPTLASPGTLWVPLSRPIAKRRCICFWKHLDL